MKQEFQDSETGVIKGINVICRLIGNNPKIDPCQECCLEENQDCMDVACIPSEREDKMYVVFEKFEDKNKQ